MSSLWGICCPGKSLISRRTAVQINRCAHDHLVAVNGAILEDYPYDYWAVCDIEVFDGLVKRNPGRMRSVSYDVSLRVPSRWAGDIHQDWQHLEVPFGYFKKSYAQYDSSAEFNSSMPFGKHLNWLSCTMFFAMALAIKKGAKLIFLYGADMAGEGYFIPGLENSRTRHNDQRWNEERLMLQEIKLLCSEKNIHVVHFPVK